MGRISSLKPGRPNVQALKYKYPPSQSPLSSATRSPVALAFLPRPFHSLLRRPRSPSISSAGSTMKFSASLVILTLAVAASASPSNLPRQRGGEQRGRHGKGERHRGSFASSSVLASSAAASAAKSLSVVGSATATASSKAVGTSNVAVASSVAKGATGVASSAVASSAVASSAVASSVSSAAVRALPLAPACPC